MHPAKQPRTRCATRPGASGASSHREGLGAKVKALFKGGAGDDAWGRLAEDLLRGRRAAGGSADLVARVRADSAAGADPVALLRQEIVDVLGPDGSLRLPQGRPGVVMVVGVNGSGETTTIGKLAKRLAGEGKQVVLAAADTFRAAAGEQLEVWADAGGGPARGQERGADPERGGVRRREIGDRPRCRRLIVDTAGRLHTKTPLMDELGKVPRVIEKAGRRSTRPCSCSTPRRGRTASRRPGVHRRRRGDRGSAHEDRWFGEGRHRAGRCVRSSACRSASSASARGPTTCVRSTRTPSPSVCCPAGLTQESGGDRVDRCPHPHRGGPPHDA